MLALLLAAMAAQSEDLHLKKNISVGGNVVSSSETSIKGQRTRDVTRPPENFHCRCGSATLARSLSTTRPKAYMVVNDPRDAAAARAAAMVTGAPVPEKKEGSGASKSIQRSPIPESGSRCSDSMPAT
jgi:hypothetical protein